MNYFRVSSNEKYILMAMFIVFMIVFLFVGAAMISARNQVEYTASYQPAPTSAPAVNPTLEAMQVKYPEIDAMTDQEKVVNISYWINVLAENPITPYNYTDDLNRKRVEANHEFYKHLRMTNCSAIPYEMWQVINETLEHNLAIQECIK